jgi:cytochrome c-type protein NapB
VYSFLPISIEENACLACHELGPAGAPDDPTPVPASHATDLRMAPDKVTDSVVGARWRCVACHVPQADAPPLVGSTFEK